MNKMNMKKVIVLLSSVIILFTACRKRDAQAPDNLVIFETTSIGLSAAENSTTIKVKTTSGVNQNTAVTVKLTGFNAAYGTKYTTTPAAVNGEILLTIPSGNNETSFTVQKVANALFDGDEKIVFTIFSSATPVLIGNVKQLTVSFAEIIANTSSLTINGGGATYPNKVFIDLSANRQSAINRTNWDLGFFTSANDFRVTLNSSVNMMAKQINKTDLNTVTLADTVGLTTELSFSQTNPQVVQLPYIDYPNGDITKTAIAAISATAIDNKVYIINRGNAVGVNAASRGWKKIRILRNANGGYTLQHADINSTTFSTIDIAKDEVTFFKEFSFENGVVQVEPAKKKWDIAWSYFANVTNFGNGEVPYMFQDIITLNRNVQVAKVLVATKPFADFSEADISTQTFLTTQNAIASDWRSGGGPTSAPAVRGDRYYIVKDGDNNYYKLRFTALTQNGERGYPAYEAILIKKG
jgi:hypothetical protein